MMLIADQFDFTVPDADVPSLASKADTLMIAEARKRTDSLYAEQEQVHGSLAMVLATKRTDNLININVPINLAPNKQ